MGGFSNELKKLSERFREITLVVNETVREERLAEIQIQHNSTNKQKTQNYFEFFFFFRSAGGEMEKLRLKTSIVGSSGLLFEEAGIARYTRFVISVSC
ncbi:unnamed protein product [Microthlaspi erraticum]|uniref:Uncharacterized protein n=1 Tax=Microthlaspi erraticum TaxID=1685480 RepID=A0A6D2HMQ5_9BRAS|nr:unnamed protein product [Microthlaspi erraticum]